MNQLHCKRNTDHGFVNQNEDSSNAPKEPIVKLSSIESSDLINSIMIVMTGKAHWSSISQFKEFLEPENIWFLTVPVDKQFKVSAIVPLFNGERFISESVGSLLSQTHPIDEIIVIDDKSTDRGLEKVQKLTETNETVSC